MPEVLDPAWEYFVGNPEIDEIFASSANHRLVGSETLDSWDQRTNKLSGFRICDIEHVDTDCAKISREKHPRDTLNPRQCKTCGELFYPRTRECVVQKYCDMDCVPHPGRRKVLPLSALCVGCDREYVPKLSRSRYCNHTCYVKNVSDVLHREYAEKAIELRECIKVNTGIEPKVCKGCTGPVLITSSKGRGKYREFCTNTCRAHYRNRKYWNAYKTNKDVA